MRNTIKDNNDHNINWYVNAKYKILVPWLRKRYYRLEENLSEFLPIKSSNQNEH